jgi:hypothetical protein
MPPAAPEAWQPAAGDLVRTAQRVERSLSVILGAAPTDGTAFSPSELLGDLGHLEDDIAVVSGCWPRSEGVSGRHATPRAAGVETFSPSDLLGDLGTLEGDRAPCQRLLAQQCRRRV